MIASQVAFTLLVGITTSKSVVIIRYLFILVLNLYFQQHNITTNKYLFTSQNVTFSNISLSIVSGYLTPGSLQCSYL